MCRGGCPGHAHGGVRSIAAGGGGRRGGARRATGRAVAAQVALARRESPHRGQQHLGLALVLAKEMPGTAEALRTGRISQWRATLLAREPACLSREDRGMVDARLAGDREAVAALELMGDRELVGHARELAYELDPVVVERRRRAEADRRVTLRPAPDVMSQLSAVLPVKDGVAVWAVLPRAADRARAAGDARSRGQVMADTLVDRVLAPESASGEVAGAAPATLMIDVVVSDAVLLGDEHGFGGPGLRPGPRGPAAGVDRGPRRGRGRAVVRRLYATPATGELVAMDSQGRRFEGKLAEFLRLRDRVCSTRYCQALVRTWTTWSTTPRAARPAPRTARACARTATTPNR